MECKSLFANGAVGGGGSATNAALSNLDKNLYTRNVDGQLQDESKGTVGGSQIQS